jgi:multidrug efflux system membrane fusion protein
MSDSTRSATRRRNWIIVGAGLAILLAGAFWHHRRSVAAAAAARAKANAASVVPVTLTTAAREDVDVSLDALGTVTPVATVTVTSRVAGALTEVHYQEGQRVKRGDLLAVIDPRPYQAVLLQAQGQLARDQALLVNAQLDRDRYRKALDEHAIPEQQLATQGALVSQDEGIVKLDQGILDAAQVNVDYTRIVAPIDGRVGLRMVDPGNIVPANGVTGLVTITQLQPMTVIFTLSQDFLAQVTNAMRSGRTLKVDAFDRLQKTAVAHGQLLTIDNQVDPATGTIRLKAIFANKDEALWPDEFVNARIVTDVEHGAVTVPARAVQSGPTGSYLFVVKPDLTVEQRAVEPGQSAQGRVVIEKGLSEGERVVVDGQYRLEQGTKVSVQHAAAQAASP